MATKRRVNNKSTGRNYDREYDMYQGTPEQKKNRAKRNAARREMERKVGKAALKGKDVDHKVPLSKGGSNARSNLQVTKSLYRTRKQSVWQRQRKEERQL